MSPRSASPRRFQSSSLARWERSARPAPPSYWSSRTRGSPFRSHTGRPFWRRGASFSRALPTSWRRTRTCATFTWGWRPRLAPRGSSTSTASGGDGESDPSPSRQTLRPGAPARRGDGASLQAAGHLAPRNLGRIRVSGAVRGGRADRRGPAPAGERGDPGRELPGVALLQPRDHVRRRRFLRRLLHLRARAGPVHPGTLRSAGALRGERGATGEGAAHPLRYTGGAGDSLGREGALGIRGRARLIFRGVPGGGREGARRPAGLGRAAVG